jgi:hypothetical protein
MFGDPLPAVELGRMPEGGGYPQRILEPGGQVAYLHFLVPKLPAGLARISTHGVTTGPGYRIRALTVARRLHDEQGLF